MSKNSIAILGSGMAACGAAYHLHLNKVSSILFDKNDYFGGHTASHLFPGGWLFDEGPHISFSSDRRIQDLLAENVGGQFQTLSTYVNNYWRGHWIKHPAQCNLNGLPVDLVVSILSDFVRAQSTPDRLVRNYEDWLRASYGDTFAETFPMEYTIKYHTTTAANLTTDWIGPRLYRPNLDEVLKGALHPSTADVHYISHFRYPTRGGFAAYLKPFVENAELRLGYKVVRVDPVAKTLSFANGESAEYMHLISSIPLPELVPMVSGAPPDVLLAASRLACTEAIVVCLGVDRADLMDAHWTYFYDRDICFARLSAPHLQSPMNVPPGCGSLQAECYFSRKYRPLDMKPADCIELVIKDLIRCGVLRTDDKLLFRYAMRIPYANVIFDLEAASATDTVLGWLDEIGVASCGRYGEWAYIWTDQSFISGEKAAQRILDRGC